MQLQVEIENFRSIGRTSLQLSPGLNILVGPNGAGKTCLLNALKFLRDTLIDGAALATAKGGGHLRQFRRNAPYIRLTVTGDYGNRKSGSARTKHRFVWALTFVYEVPEGVTLSEESFEILAQENTARYKTVFTVRMDRASKKIQVTDGLSHAAQDLFRHEAKTRSSKKYGAFLRRVRQELDSISKLPDRSFFPIIARADPGLLLVQHTFLSLEEYNIVPDEARQATDQLPFAVMEPSGRQVSEVIEALSHRQDYRLRSFVGQRRDPYYSSWHFDFRLSTMRKFDSQWALGEINHHLASAVSPIASVSTATDPTNGRRFVVFHTAESATFYPSEVSDGTLKWLCLLVSIYVPLSRLYLLEEPENFLHPWMQQRLLTIMRDQSERAQTTYLLTTHSSTILNSARPSEITVVNQTSSGTVATPITHKDQIDKILATTNFGIGDLWVSGAIGGVPTGDADFSDELSQ